jgi:Sec7-like guanine-nucleotide exchange factor
MALAPLPTSFHITTHHPAPGDSGLTYMFDALKAHGAQFSADFWGVVAKGVIFPIFDDLRLNNAEQTKFGNKEELTVWLSTTLIQGGLRCACLLAWSLGFCA